MSIRVYPSILPGKPIETHEPRAGQTLAEWLDQTVEGFDAGRDHHPITVDVNGVTVAPEMWAHVVLYPGKQVDIRVLPQKGVVSSIGDAIGSVFSASLSIGQAIIDPFVSVFKAAFSWLIPDTPDVDMGEQGSSIYDPSAQANRPKVNGVIPEIAGRHKVFPDYLSQPRKYFAARKSQAVDILMCVGVGEYDIEEDQLRVGESPVQALGQVVDYQFFGPGEDVTGHPAHKIWYVAPEVGASLGASNGLRLRGLASEDRQYDDNGTSMTDTTTLTEGVPESWVEDMIAAVDVYQTWTVTDDPDPMLAQIISGETTGLAVGMTVNVKGSTIAGTYVITTLSATEMTWEDAGTGDPINNLDTGDHVSAIDLDGAEYRIEGFVGPEDEPTGVEWQRLLPNGDDDTSWTQFPAESNTRIVITINEQDSPGLWAGPFLACPPQEQVEVIEWDVFAPQGLGEVDEDNILELSRGVQLQYREAGSGGTWINVNRTYTGQTRDQLGWTETLTLPSAITPEVRIRRVGAEETALEFLDRLEWLSLRSEMPGAPTSYDGVTTLAMTIQGSDAISGQSENQISVIGTRILDGVPTRSIAEWFRYVAYSVGYDPEDLDQDELDRLDGVWAARGETFDFSHDQASTVKDTLARCLRAGMADMTIADGLLTPVRDEPRDELEEMYSPQNMTQPLSQSVEMLRDDDTDGIDIEYFDADSWTNQTVECRLPGDLGLRAERIRLEGVTSRTQAWRIGMRERRSRRYRRWQYRWATEMDALNSQYWSYCAVAGDVPGFAKSALVDSVDGDTIRATEPLPWDEFEQYVFSWRRPDGTTAGTFPCERGDNDYELVALDTSEMPVVDRDRELPHLLFGQPSEVLVTRIQPQGSEAATVEAVNYAPEVYEDDDNSPPA